MLIALQTLRWGDGEIQPGESVPEGEAGRDYDALLRLHLIADAGTADGLRAELANVTAERDALKARVAELEAAHPPEDGSPDADAKNAEAADGDPDALPDGWTATGGGWFNGPNDQKVHGRAALDAATGQ